MGIAVGMKEIARDIVASQKERVADVAGLQREVHHMLGGFREERDEQGAHMRRSLAQGKARIEAQGRAMRKGFQVARKEMCTDMQEELSRCIKSIRGEVSRMLRESSAANRRTASQMRRRFAQDTEERKETNSELKADARHMIHNFHSVHKHSSAQMKKEMAEDSRHRRSAVGKMRKETQDDLKEARSAWNGMSRAMHGSGKTSVGSHNGKHVARTIPGKKRAHRRKKAH